METGLSGHPLTPQLPTGEPSPLFHLLERLRQMGGKPTVRRLKCVLECLEFTERYFAGVAGGLLRKLEDPPNLGPLAHNAMNGAGLRRLLRFCLNRLEMHGRDPGVINLFSCFYLHGKRSLPYSHTRWLGLVPGTEGPNSETLFNYGSALETLSVPSAFEAMEAELRNLSEILQSFIEGGSSFFESHEHFARLDEFGWQCTLQKEERFIELVPAIPARLIPLEAQAPTSAPQTEDEHLLNTNPFLPDTQAAEESDTPEEEPPAEEQPTPEEQLAKLAQTVKDDPPDEDADLLSSSETALHNPYERWSAGELKSFKASLQQVYPRLDLDRVPSEYLNKLSRFISSVSSGYILVEGKQGSGKTLLTQAFRDSLLESSLEVTPLLFSVKNQFYPDAATFLEQLNESLRIRPGLGRKSFEALDPAVIKDLNVRTPGEARANRFSSFLSELKLVNGTRLVLLLDGLDEGSGSNGRGESLFSYLPPHLPDGVYVVLSYHPDRFRPGDRHVLETIHSGPSLKIDLAGNDGLYRDFIERFLSWGGGGPLSEGLAETLVERSGGRLATAQHFLDGLRCELLEGEDDLPPAELVYEGLLDRLYERVPDRYLDLFLLLATSDEPVSGEELSNLGISRTDVLELIHSLPSLFHCHQDQKLGLNLAHRALRLHIQRTFLTSYAQSCLRLAKRAMQRISESELAILPIKEDLERLGEALRRLLRWAVDSQDADFLSQVCSDTTVNRLRRRVFAAMEEKTLFHRKALVLDTFIQGLMLLVEDDEREEFREELAWSLSSRALSYYHLGQYRRALEDIETALNHFRILVDDNSQEALRNGLAAAYNRRSEIYVGLQEWSKALTDADRAVLNYESVVDSGRTDLMSLWMLARHNRATIYRQLKSYPQAENDLECALTGYLKLVDRENRRDLRPHLASVYRSRALLALDQGKSEYALTAANASLDLLETLVHQENYEHLRNELASIYNDRGTILYQTGVLEEAENDYASAISIRTYLVAEGRIDVRTDLAKTYANRGLCLLGRGNLKDARESFDRSVEILDRLIEEEKREDLYGERAFALNCRGSLFRTRGDFESAREDLSAAVGDYRLAVVSQSSKHLEELAGTLNALAEVSLLSGDTEMARKSCLRVLEIFEEKLSPQRREQLAAERAAAHHNLGEALRQEGDIQRAEEEFKESIDLLTRLVENQGRSQLTNALATSLLRYAQLPIQSPNTQLKLASRALALFRASDTGLGTANLVDAYLLRAAAFRALGTLGNALDDVTAVVDLLEDKRWEEPTLGGAMVTALLERASLFSELHDQAASLLDMDRAATTVDELDHVLSEPEIELRHCHILLERARLLTGSDGQDFESAVDLLRDLDNRLENLTKERIAKPEFKELRKRTVRTFKGLRLLALLPTREGGRYDETVDRLTLLLKAVSKLRPTFLGLLNSDWVENHEIDPISRLRVQRGWSLLKLGNLEYALEDFEEAIDAIPQSAAATNPDVLEFLAEVESGRGAILDTLGRTEDALEAYSRGVEAFAKRPESALSPRRATCLNNRALLLQKLGRYEEALDDLDPAIEIARSNYQRAELLARSVQKADMLRHLGRVEDSLATLKDSLQSGQETGSLTPAQELPLRIGIYQLSSDAKERRENLARVLRLLTEKLAEDSADWREKCVTILSELPLPEATDPGMELEELIAKTVETLLPIQPLGYTPLTETLLRRASKLHKLAKSANHQVARYAAGLYCLATRLCWLEYKKYGSKSLPRLVRCYLLTAQSLVEPDAPRSIKGLGEGIEAITGAVTLEPPTGEFEVEVNNMARLWLGLPPSKALQAGISRATLQKLRRW
jgi:tetratricopeptide (TPR) repeat protein/Cdc6-like AAA superfamily ATPase